MTSKSSSSSRAKFFRRVISAAIEGQTCPICLENLRRRTSAVLRGCYHAYCEACIRKWSLRRRKCPLCNSDFDSWFSEINLSSETFRTHRLQDSERSTTTTTETSFHEQHRFRRFEMMNSSVRRRRRTPSPRRSFGRPGSVGDDVIAMRKLQWRSSIYNRRLKAVPINPPCQIVFNKEHLQSRIEPWIRRELEAMGDSDPLVLVRLASCLYLSSLGNGGGGNDGRFADELRPYLLDKTDTFWHELRCFAQRSLDIDNYDKVVEYVHQEDSI